MRYRNPVLTYFIKSVKVKKKSYFEAISFVIVVEVEVTFIIVRIMHFITINANLLNVKSYFSYFPYDINS